MRQEKNPMSLVTAKPVADLAVELLRRQIVLPALVSRIGSANYTGSGGTVTLRVPVPRTAHEQKTRGANIEFDEIEEESVDVQVGHWYDATTLSDEEMTLDLVDFGRQVLAPQVASVAEAAENQLADVMNGLAPDEEITWGAEPDPDADEDTLLAIREKLSDNKVPLTNRSVAVSSTIAGRLLKIDKFTRADARGAAGLTALEAAQLGTIYGMGVYESAAIDSGTAVGFHRSAFAFGNLAPVVPQGASGASVTDNGLALRTVRMFNPTTLSNVSVVSTFAGASVVEEDGEVTRAILVAGEGS
jgi:hypothetical protein